MSHTPALSDAQPLLHALSGLWAQALYYVHTQPLLRVALGAMALVVVGGIIRGAVPLVGGVLRFVGNIGLIYAMLAAILQVAQGNGFGLGVDVPLAGDGQPEQSVSGGVTRVPMAPDGHFWVRAQVNGVSRRFLVDTGATLTTLSPGSADAAAIRPKRWGEQVELNTANGRTTGTLATIDSLRVGNVVARHIEAVVAPGLGETNVLGMNFLSRLAGWRVEGRTMILTPHHPAATPSAES
jgi:aspartyl protease family protein